ncbi:MAG: alginate export family protein [Gemmatimonadetes bacterium]|jgi:hypothetical protein|nr:alginate export family protein [Gemmatimonadota bacterium]MBT5141546.1 alginate export family protein [Gemmatimonadota bacterium]MBT5590849.1 alginate export family protein [Gemmatimonadota bacterium]MBT5965087.1 alginate export family protein [Gemmatimonadota bacterium]MBT7455604.1 alginate export family protein [Gemmatimonadota bacterium]
MRHLSWIMFLGALSITTAAQADTKLTYSGVYTAWSQSQHAFRFDADAYDDNYIVQMLRLNLALAPNERMKVVTRFDMGQGWWGVDNADRTVNRTGATGGSSLFDFKDTNFLLHVDQAYAQFTLAPHPLTFRVGRQSFRLGNKLVIDNNLDGIQLDIGGVGDGLTIGWAKMSEGGDNISDIDASKTGGADNRDADLLLVNFRSKMAGGTYNLFSAYYTDRSSDDGNAYIPDHLNYFKTRFSAQPTTLTVFGLAGDTKLGAIKLAGEVEYLTGTDDVDNATHGAQAWDINNGDLSGFNLYLKADMPMGDRLSVGGVFGMGSGDDDLTSGAGNVNKIRTSGFFYLTEIWEDSIMPDEEGITPQGLGAPNVRGYRELENTTALQVNGTFKPSKKLSLFASATYLQATQDIPAWNNDGTPNYALTANDLGQEVDFRVSYLIEQGLSAHLRGGIFMPGDAAGYLINGNALSDDSAWELKGVITLKF